MDCRVTGQSLWRRFQLYDKGCELSSPVYRIFHKLLEEPICPAALNQNLDRVVFLFESMLANDFSF